MKKKLKSDSPLDAATCSPSLRMIRLVIQLVDTPGNREAMDAIHGYAKKKKVQGPHGALKREDVQVIELQTTRPRKSPENAELSDRHE